LTIVIVVIIIEAAIFLIRKYVINKKFKDYSKEFKVKDFINKQEKIKYVLNKPRKT
jgi:hypothetical protein